MIRLPVILFVLTNSINASSQNTLVLQHQKKAKSIKVNLQHEFSIVTNDTSYYTKIVSYTDSSLLIPVLSATGETEKTYDTVRYKKYSKSNFFQVGTVRDTMYVEIYESKIYRKDTLSIPFNDIEKLQRSWIKNGDRLGEPFGWAVVASALILGVGVPVAAIDDGWQGVRNVLALDGVVLGATLPFFAVGQIQKNYDLRKKWRLKVIGSKK